MIHWLRYILSGDYREKCALEVKNPRDPGWRKFEKPIIAEIGRCESCGLTIEEAEKLGVDLELHHVIAFHIDRTKELLRSNVICLCMCRRIAILARILKLFGVGKRTYKCHYEEGHTDPITHKSSWSINNPNVREQSAANLAKMQNVKAIVFPWQKKPQHVITEAQQAWNRQHTHSDTPPIGFISDGYTDAPDLPDMWPSFHHDHLFTPPHLFDDGTPCTFDQANDLFLFRCQSSTSFLTRFWGPVYYDAICEYGQPYWDAGKKFQPTLKMLWKHKGSAFRRKSRFSKFPPMVG